MRKTKKTFLVVLGAGGHTSQILRLTEQLGKQRYEYVIASDDKLSEKKIKHKGKIFRIINPRRMQDKSLLKVILRFIPSTIQTIIALANSKADVVVSCGPAMCLHVCFLAKYLFGKKIIFIESWSRVYKKSSSGKIIHGFADLFFVQWPEMLKKYPKAVYAGRLG